MRSILLSLPLASLPALALAAPPEVVTDIPAVQSLAAQVMGELGKPTVLLEQGANAHNYQLRPSQARALHDAELMIWVGPELTPWLARATDGLNARSLELLHAPETLVHELDEATNEDAQDDHAAESAEAHGDEGHDHEGLDPHAWLDPENAKIWLGLIADELAAMDPENATTYRANAATAQAGTDRLRAEVTALLAPVADRPFVVFHDAYGYFMERFDLDIAGAVALGDAAAPGAQHLSELRGTLTDAKVVCAFPEAQHDPKLLAQLVEGSPVRLGGALDPSGSAQEPGPQLYDGLILGMAQTIADCLGRD